MSTVVTNDIQKDILPPHMVALANQAANLKATVKDAETELKAIAATFDAWSVETGLDVGRNASGHIVVKRGGRVVHPFLLDAFREAYPALAVEFTGTRTDAWWTYPK